jgi:hypothetical protein
MNEHIVELILGQGVTFAAGLITAWVKLQGELVKLRSRVHVLEQSEDKIQSTLEQLVGGIRRIELMLAKKGIG